MNQNIVLFEDEKNCCACGACYNICPQNAISMKEDAFGFVYPVISTEKCTQCGLCNKTCPLQQKRQLNKPFAAYASKGVNRSLIQKSASGGVFTSIAKVILEMGGVCYGCAMYNVGDKFLPQHIKISFEEQLVQLQGSKYVQSDIGNCYKQVKEDIISDKMVLFSGTPCQVAGLRSYLGSREYSNLIMVDIICHGVPNRRFFNDYIKCIESREKGKVIDFMFRDKTKGGGHRGSFLIDQDGIKKKATFSAHTSSYYSIYLKNEISRECCYSCPFAQLERIGDLTLGDYWRLDEAHPNYLVENDGFFNESQGVSCVLVNTEKGNNFLKKLDKELILKQSEVSKVSRGNSHLNQPSVKGVNRSEIMQLYKEEGYFAIEKWFRKKLGIKRYVYILWDAIPDSIRTKIKM